MPKPPRSVRQTARKGLKAREKQPEGKKSSTRTGMARANQLAKGETVSTETLKRMKSFFARHEQHKDTERGKVAWQLWGGDAGREWAKQELKKRED